MIRVSIDMMTQIKGTFRFRCNLLVYFFILLISFSSRRPRRVPAVHARARAGVWREAAETRVRLGSIPHPTDARRRARAETIHEECLTLIFSYLSINLYYRFFYSEDIQRTDHTSQIQPYQPDFPVARKTQTGYKIDFLLFFFIS